MNNIAEIGKDICTGCAACVQTCPKACIKLETDEYGFLYPQVEDDCIHCGKCLNVCPAHLPVCGGDVGQYCYMLTAKNKKLEEKSASGGFCAVLADYYIDKYNAVVFGCVMDESFEVHHQAITQRDEVHKIQGSKYVQSSSLQTFKEAKAYLAAGRYVLYMATPCQIAGLKSYLSHQYEKLITVDIICHGVPSAKAFQLYIKYLSDIKGKSVSEYRFRNKTCSDRTGYISKTKYNHGVVYRRPSEDIFFYLFSQGKIYRESCYNCRYACIDRQGDFTCGDCGSRSLNNDFMPYDAVSSLIINTKKAQVLWNDINSLFHSIEIDLQTEVAKNKQLHEYTALPPDRDELCKAMMNNEWDKLSDKYLPRNKASLSALIKSRTPVWIKKKIKKFIHNSAK